MATGFARVRSRNRVDSYSVQPFGEPGGHAPDGPLRQGRNLDVGEARIVRARPVVLRNRLADPVGQATEAGQALDVGQLSTPWPRQAYRSDTAGVSR